MTRPQRHPFTGMPTPDAPQPDPDMLRVTWGGFVNTVPLGAIGTHFLVLGTTGSGKSTIIKMLANSVLSDGMGDLRYRAVVYDPKRELIPFLHRLDIPDDRVVITNPYDARCSAWDMASDTREAGDYENIAKAIIPVPDGSDRRDENVFFTNAANQTLTAVIEALATRAPRNWDFRDIIESCSNPWILKQLLRTTQTGRDTLTSYYKPYDKTAKSVFATVRSYLAQYGVLASLWHTAPTRFSMDDWIKGRAIIVLGSRPRRDSIVRLANSLMMHRAIELVIDLEEDQERDLSWFFLDELREAGRFPKLSLLMNTGRSKGGRVVLGYQDQSGMIELMGDDAAEELVSYCGNKAILNLASGQTMEWASRLCARELQERHTWTTDPEGRSTTSTTMDYMDKVPPIRFMQLPLAKNHGGAINGYFVHAEHETYAGSMTAEEVDAAMPPKLPKKMLREPFKERPISDQERKPWREADYARLGLKPGRDDLDSEDDFGGDTKVGDGPTRLRTMDWHS